jgi:hypothetical protein
MQAEKMRQTSEARGRQGRELDLVFVEGDEKVKDPDERSLQRPRIFYRREVEFLPLIIAKTARGQPR